MFISLLCPIGLNAVRADEYNFKIENGVLLYYYGTDSVVTIPDGVTHIGKHSFEYNDTVQKIIANSVKEIDEYAFSGCESLVEVEFPKVEAIGRWAFQGCYLLEKVYMPEVEIIETGAFSYCESIVNIDFPKLDMVDEYTFEDCTSLKKVVLPKVKTIKTGAFEECCALEEINFPKAESVGNNAFEFCSSLKKVVLSNANEIEQGAFSECESLVEIELPKVEVVKHNMFNNCTSLKKVSLSNVKTIEEKVFFNCESLVEIEFLNAETVGEAAFMDCISLKKVNLPNVTIISEKAFWNCKSLVTIELPNTKTVECAAFDSCIALKKVSLPKVQNLNETAFAGCMLKQITLSSINVLSDCLLENIDYGAEIYIPKNKATSTPEFQTCAIDLQINDICLTDSKKPGLNLKEIYMLKDDRETLLFMVNIGLNDKVKYSSANPKIAKVNKHGMVEAVGVGKTTITAEWNGKSFKCPITVYERVTKNRPLQLDKQYGLWKLSDYQVVKALFTWLDTNCEYSDDVSKGNVLLDYQGVCAGYTGSTGILLDYFKIPNESIDAGFMSHAWNYIKIGNDWFQWDATWSIFLSTDKFMHSNYSGTAASDYYDKSGHFGFKAIHECNTINPDKKYSSRESKSKPISSKAVVQQLTKNELGVSQYKDYYYKENKNGTITIVEYVGTAKKIKVPSMINGKKVTRIGEHAFCFSRKLQSITLPSTLEEIEGDAFSYCTSLKSITIPDSVKKMGRYQFYGCTSLTKVVLSKNLKEIGERTFYDCSKLKEIVIPSSVKKIGEDAMGTAKIVYQK